ncbi:MAG: AAA family ATPase [Xenococcaceae cyanobacterium]
MTKPTPTSRFWNYIAECVRLLYWIYFKPFTFNDWLRDIHPELTPTDNPFAKRAEFATNRRLRRYAGQVWWLIATVPQLVVLLVAPIYSLTADEPFNWLRSELFLLGWLIGLLVARIVYLLVGQIFNIIIILSIFLLLIISINFIPPFLNELSSVAFGVALGVAFGVGGGVALGVAGGVALGVAFILGVLRVYFWLPELLWTLLLFLFARQGNVAQYLCYLPPRFDQLIILPLPFMDTLIVEAYRENRAAARQMINYLTTSTHQQEVAAQAMAGIAVDSLNHCQTLGEIIAISHQLTWIPSPPPAQLGTMLPQFLEISQSVRAADTATSAYRKTELLISPITSLINLRDSIAFSRDAGLATTFGSIADRWLSILQTARSNLEEQARESQEIPQVYIAGAALDPETAKSRFKGRQDLFREIETIALALEPPVLLFYGGRRTGKTSALKYLPQKVGAELVPLLVDLQGVADATTLPGVATSLASQIMEAARKSRNIRLPTPDAYSLQVDPFPALRHWFSQIEGTAPGKRFLLCLDEFERLSEVIAETNSKAPLNFLRHIMQHRSSWILLFSGAHTLDEIDSYWSDYLINARSLRVTYLEQPEARELIVQPVEGFPEIYEPEAVNLIIQWTRCQPYLVQLMCSVLVDYLNRKAQGNGRLTKATPQDVETIIPKVFETGGMYFRELWHRSLTEEQRQTIKRLVYGEAPIQGDKTVCRKLVQKEVLEQTESGDWGFQVPLVQCFVEGLLMEQ